MQYPLFFKKLLLCDDRIVTNSFHAHLNGNKKIDFAFYNNCCFLDYVLNFLVRFNVFDAFLKRVLAVIKYSSITSVDGIRRLYR